MPCAANSVEIALRLIWRPLGPSSRALRLHTETLGALACVRCEGGRRVAVIACGFRPFHAIDTIHARQGSRGFSPWFRKARGLAGAPSMGSPVWTTRRDRTHCWIVHIERRRRVWNRSFSDGVYGGKTNALRAARAFRDEILVSHLPMTRAEYAAIRRKNNRSGFPGVYRYAAVKDDLGKAGRASLLDCLLDDAGRQAGASASSQSGSTAKRPLSSMPRPRGSERSH